MFLNHGINKISAGTAKWEKLGSSLTDLIGFESLKIFFWVLWHHMLNR